jgi:predicted GIY-YIG superfamily endonuclease
MQHIYLITNTHTGMVYVGRTKNTTHRYSVHRSELRLGKHSNPKLQADYTANPNIWHYQVIERLESREEAKKAEADWINAFPQVYNLLGRKDCPCIRGPWHLGRISYALRKPCTVDGVTIYPSKSALIAAHGQGRTGARHPNFRYV